MITRADLVAAISWLEVRWGTAGNAWDRWEEFAADFEPFDAAEFRKVLDEWFRSGEKFPPRPGQLIAKLRVGAERQEFTPDTCRHPEPWGFDILEDHDRECFCRLCGYSWVVPPDGVLSPLELEQRGPRRDVA